MINKKKICRLLSALLISGNFFVMPCASAEIYNADGEYTMSKYETPIIAEERAIKDAMRRAQEQAGIYIESYSHMKHFQLLEDEVITIAANVLKFAAKPALKRNFLEDGSIKILAFIKVEIDDSDLEKYLNQSIDNRTQMNSQLESLRKANHEQEKRIKELEEQIAAGISNDQQEENIKNQFASEDKIFLSNKKVDEGWKILNKKNYNRAFDTFNEAVNLNPNNAGAYEGRGTIYKNLQQYDAAITDYSQAIQLNPNDVYAYINRGNAYKDLKQYDAAISDYNKVIKLNPRYGYAYNNRGNAYFELQQYDAAISDFNKAIQLDPNYAVAYNNRGNAYKMLKNYDAAIAEYNKAIELDPNFAYAYNNRGNAYQDGFKNYNLAIADYNKAIELDSNDFVAYNNRGNTYMYGFKQYDAAISDYNKAIELNHNFAVAYSNRGWAYIGLQDYQNAVKDFNKALELNSNDSLSYKGRAKCYQALGIVIK